MDAKHSTEGKLQINTVIYIRLIQSKSIKKLKIRRI